MDEWLLSHMFQDEDIFSPAVSEGADRSQTCLGGMPAGGSGQTGRKKGEP